MLNKQIHPLQAHQKSHHYLTPNVVNHHIMWTLFCIISFPPIKIYLAFFLSPLPYDFKFSIWQCPLSPSAMPAITPRTCRWGNSAGWEVQGKGAGDPGHGDGSIPGSLFTASWTRCRQRTLVSRTLKGINLRGPPLWSHPLCVLLGYPIINPGFKPPLYELRKRETHIQPVSLLSMSSSWKTRCTLQRLS